MKVIVVSDSHGRDDLHYDLQERYPDAGAFLHCGDVEAPAEDFPGYLIVQGNNDYYYDIPASRVLPIGGHRILLIHSHQFSYRKRDQQMIEFAKERGCDIICYGHTHVADNRKKEGMLLLNPGSLRYSRDGRPPSYAVLTLTPEKADAEIIFLEEPEPKKKHFWF